MGDNGLQFTFFYTVFVRLGSVLSFFFLKDLCKIGVKCLNKDCPVEASGLGEFFLKNSLITDPISLIILELFSLSVEFWWFVVFKELAHFF